MRANGPLRESIMAWAQAAGYDLNDAPTLKRLSVDGRHGLVQVRVAARLCSPCTAVLLFVR